LTDDIEQAELDVGLVPDTSLTDAFRRNRIIARIRSMPYATKQKLIEIGTAFWEQGIDIVESNENYQATVIFLGGIPSENNFPMIIKQITEIAPAHIKFIGGSVFKDACNAYLASTIQGYTTLKLEMEQA